MLNRPHRAGLASGVKGSASQTSALRRVREQLRQAECDVRDLRTRRDTVLTSERGRIARELHDGLQQVLAAARMTLVDAARHLEVDAQAARGLLAELDAHLMAAGVDLRRVVGGLQPVALSRRGLLPALRDMAESFGARTAVRCDVVAPASLPASGGVSPDVAHCIYRVVQEALNNVEKHAQARNAVIEMEAGGDALQSIVIHDDGRGIDLLRAARPDAFGLVGVDALAREIGAELRITAGPGGGTRVELRLSPQAGGAGLREGGHEDAA
jgi:signal transduction histidine kinase